MQLRPHQIEMLNHINTHNPAWIFAGTSTGKTFTTLSYIQQNNFKKVIIAVPSSVLVKQWEKEIKKMVILDTNITVFSFAGKAPNITNCDLLVIDEIHKLKGLGVWYRKVKAIKAKQIIGLTATPFNHQHELELYLRFEGKIKSKKQYMLKYGAVVYDLMTQRQLTYNGDNLKNHYKILHMKNMKQLEADVYKNAIKIELPKNLVFPLNFKDTLITVDSKYHQKIVKLIKEITETQSAERHTLNSVLNSDIDFVDPILHPLLKSNFQWKRKIEKIKQIKDKKIIIIYNYIREKKTLEKYLQNTTASLSKFEQTDARYLLKHVRSVGTGIDGIQLYCNCAVFYSYCESATDWVQFKGRIKRVGMKKEAYIYRIYNQKEKIRWQTTLDQAKALEQAQQQ